MKKVLLFYNPKAGNAVFTMHLDLVISSFAKKDMLVVPVRIGGSLTVEKMMSDLDISGYHKIIVAGGDGTINRIVNAMIKNDVYVPLAIYPAGTANDLASYFHIPNVIEEMIAISLSENYTTMDVGVAGKKCFVNVLAIGMLVDISQKTDPNIKSTMGLAGYYLKGLSELPKVKASHLRITTDERVVDEKTSAVLIMNGRSAGGFKHLAPESAINDGLFDVIIFKEMLVPVMAPVLLSALTGQHISDNHVIYFKTSKLKIESMEGEILTDVDGERGTKLPFEVSMLRERLLVNTLEADMKQREW
ncbi:MAG: YegS/Rv2252/BmrU family lipid kinase [Clostridiales Family XIII bacterium]|jgi:YegS/Rv2252/BmrU family lipid kinase|nr:YegS/Rv2252/BmrU family lipid kinase [Clostridiales Family XIII bacterium]